MIHGGFQPFGSVVKLLHGVPDVVGVLPVLLTGLDRLLQ